MKRFASILMFILFGVPPGPPAMAQCPGGFCPLPQSGYEWKRPANDAGKQYLYHNSQRIGGVDEQGNYRTYDAATDKWSDVCQPPWETEAKSYPLFGVDSSKIKKEPTYTLNYQRGKVELSKSEAADIISDEKLTDDSTKLRVTVIAPQTLGQTVVDEITKAIPDVNDWATVRNYPPDHWAVSQAGFVTTGKPTIYCQAPSGKVLHRQDDYIGEVTAAAEALRKAKKTTTPQRTRT